MEETLDFALELNTELANFYCAMAYPGSRLYDIAIQEGWKLPKEWHSYSQHSYETIPLPTKYISTGEVLRFRDNAFSRYYENADYLNMIEHKFGDSAKEHIKKMTETRLRRKLLEE